MEFFIITDIVNRNHRKILRVFLGILCVADFLILIGELLSEGEFDFTFLIPLIILVPFVLKSGDKISSADVLCNLSESEEEFVLIMSNVIIDKKDVLSRKYHIKKSTTKVSAIQEGRVINIVGDGFVELINQNGDVVFAQNFNEQTIELDLREQTFQELKGYLSTYIVG